MKRYNKCLIYSLFLFFPIEVFASPINFENLPKLNCSVESATGSFFGYLPPKIGDNLQFSFKDALYVQDKLSFKSGSYIPLNGPLKIVREVYSNDGVVEELRLRSGDAKQWSVTIDIHSVDSFNTPRAKIFIYIEEPLMSSIAVLKCED